MQLRWKVEVNNFGADVQLKTDPVLQFKDNNNEWVDVVVEEIEVGIQKDDSKE